MEIAVLTHGLKIGGAQESTIDTIKHLVNDFDIKVNIITCSNCNKEYLNLLSTIGSNVNIAYVECSTRNKYPYIKKLSAKSLKLLKSSDIIWVSDEFYLSVLKIKKICKKPVVTHLRSYALICPKWTLLRGLNEICSKCSIKELINCRVKTRLSLYKLSRIYGVRLERSNLLYTLFDPLKGILDYLLWPIDSNLIENIDGFIAVSSYVKNIHKQMNPIMARKQISIIYNPIDTYDKQRISQGNEINNEEEIIVYASGDSLLKGSHIIIPAIANVINYGFRHVKLYMFNIKNPILFKKIAKSHNIVENIKLLPRVNRKMLHEFIKRKAKLVVMPSLWPEPFGRIPVEANKLGVPAIVSNRGGLPETIEKDITGYIVPPTPDSLAKAIINAMNKDWNSQNIAEITRKRFDSRRSTLLLLDFFYKMLQ